MIKLCFTANRELMEAIPIDKRLAWVSALRTRRQCAGSLAALEECHQLYPISVDDFSYCCLGVFAVDVLGAGVDVFEMQPSLLGETDLLSDSYYFCKDETLVDLDNSEFINVKARRDTALLDEATATFPDLNDLFCLSFEEIALLIECHPVEIEFDRFHSTMQAKIRHRKLKNLQGVL